jgi:hypothetical protein
VTGTFKHIWHFLLVLVFVSGCRSYEPCSIHSSDIKPIAFKGFPALKYRASIDIFRKHFSGILLYKQTDSLVSHIVFVTELGMTVFDFEVRADSFRLISAFPGFESKPKLMGMLKQDLGLVFRTAVGSPGAEKRSKNKTPLIVYRIPSQGTHTYYWVDEQSRQPVRAYQGNRFRNKVRVRYENYSNGEAGEVSLKHKGLPVRMSLHLIPAK